MLSASWRLRQVIGKTSPFFRSLYSGAACCGAHDWNLFKVLSLRMRSLVAGQSLLSYKKSMQEVLADPKVDRRKLLTCLGCQSGEALVHFLLHSVRTRCGRSSITACSSSFRSKLHQPGPHTRHWTPNRRRQSGLRRLFARARLASCEKEGSNKRRNTSSSQIEMNRTQPTMWSDRRSFASLSMIRRRMWSPGTWSSRQKS